MKYVVLFPILVFSIVFAVSANDDNFALASHGGSHHDEKMSHAETQHHTPHNGMCAPGYASLKDICVLNDRCGPGAYPGKVCIMDGKMQPYLKPLHQKHAGISVDNIVCAEGKHLMFKHHNASPACVNPQSVEKLEQRGWLVEKPAMACTMEYDPVCGVDGITYGNSCQLHTQHMTMSHKGECIES